MKKQSFFLSFLAIEDQNQNYRISLEILAHLPARSLWHLISRPLLTYEQFLMRSKLKLLAGSVRQSTDVLSLDLLCAKRGSNEGWLGMGRNTSHGRCCRINVFAITITIDAMAGSFGRVALI